MSKYNCEAMLEWSETEKIGAPKYPDPDKANKYYNDVTRAVTDAIAATKYSEDDDAKSSVESIESELNWFYDEFEKLTEYAESADSVIDDLLSIQDSLLMMLWDRLDEEEMDEYTTLAVKNQIKGTCLK